MTDIDAVAPALSSPPVMTPSPPPATPPPEEPQISSPPSPPLSSSSTSSSSIPSTDLPAEILALIFRELDLVTLLTAAQICRRWNGVAQDSSILKRPDLQQQV